MVYELTELVADYLLQHNHRPLSFYDEMLHRKQEEFEAQEKEHRRLTQQEYEKKRIEEAKLERKIR